MEFVKMISTKKALYRTVYGYKIKKLIKPPKSLHGSELTLYNNYKKSAIKRGYSFELSTDSFSRIIKNNCYYCNTQPKQVIGDLVYNGIDRLENDKGYNIENCLACCGKCNKMKSDMSIRDFEDHIMNIYNNISKQYNAFETLKKDPNKIGEVSEIVNERLENAGALVQQLWSNDETLHND